MKETGLIFQGWGVRAIIAGTKTQTRRVVKPQPPAEAASAHLEMIRVGPCAYDFEDHGVWHFGKHRPMPDGSDSSHFEMLRVARCPYGVPGDRLWVRETYCSPSVGIVGYSADSICGAWMYSGEGWNVWMHHGYILEAPGYREATRDPSKCIDTYSLKKYGGKWKPSIHMPRWASRLLLEITDVRVQRVQEISESDAQREGWAFQGLQPNQSYDPVMMDTARQWYRSEWDRINAGRGFGWDVNPWCWCLSFKRVNPA